MVVCDHSRKRDTQANGISNSRIFSPYDNNTTSILDRKQKRINGTGRKAKRSQAGHHSYLLASEPIPRSDELLPIFLEV